MTLGGDEALVSDSDRHANAIFKCQRATAMVEVDPETRTVPREMKGDAVPDHRQPRGELEAIAILRHAREPVDDARPDTSGRRDVYAVGRVAVRVAEVEIERPREVVDGQVFVADHRSYDRLNACRQRRIAGRNLQFEALTKDRPTFMVPRVIDTTLIRKGVVKTTIAVELHCEHSGKRLTDLDGDQGTRRGYFEFRLPRAYLQYLGPTFSVLTKLATGLSVGVGTVLKGSLDQAAFEGFEFELEAAASSIEIATLAGDAIDEVIDLDADAEVDIDLLSGPPTEELAVRFLQDLVESRDPHFGGLLKRKTGDNRIIWVDPRFSDLYEPIASAAQVQT